MTAPRVPGLFITGTDTGVGKTHVAAMIVRAMVLSGRRVGVYKPAASGCTRQHGQLVSDDAVALWQAAGRPGELEHVCPQRFEAPLAPHLAARAEGREIDAERLRRGLDYWLPQSDVVVVEGAGGLMSPLGDEDYVAHVACDLGMPLVVVSRNVLGTINATLQTLITAAAFGVTGHRPPGTGSFFGYLNLSTTANIDGRKMCLSPYGRRGQSHFHGETGPICEERPCRRENRDSPRDRLLGEGLDVAAVVFNHPAPSSADDVSLATNRQELARRCVPPILAEVAYGSDRFDREVDWFALAR